MLNVPLRTDYSPDIRLRLEADGRSWPVSKLGPDHFVPSQEIELQPCNGQIVMSIDGEEHIWKVRLLHGAVPFDETVSITYRPK